MKLSMENGTVVCSLENKNGEFLSACAGMFDGFLRGKLKLYMEDPDKLDWSITPEEAEKSNLRRLDLLLIKAKYSGIEIDAGVYEFQQKLQKIVSESEARKRAKEEERKKKEEWERLCRRGCRGCKYLKYFIDVPICEATGTQLEERNKQEYIGGVLRLFNLVPFPSEDCPFNINKK